MGFDSNPSFVRPQLSLGVRLALCIVLSVSLLAADGYFKMLDPVRRLLALPLYPLQWAVNEPARLSRQADDYVSAQSTLQSENVRLRAENLQHSVQLSRMNTVERELAELKQLLGLYKQDVNVVSAAEVMKIGNDPFAYRLIIGSSNNGTTFKAGQPVLDSGGLLGLITQVQPLGTEVTLAISKGQMVPVMIERTGERTILYGYGGGVDVRYLLQYADVKQGDRLVTSGIDGVYPAGLPVARITAVERNAGAQFVQVSCQALAGMQRARYVLVVENPPAKAVSTPMPSTAVNGRQPTAAGIYSQTRAASATQTTRLQQNTQRRVTASGTHTAPASSTRAQTTVRQTASGTQTSPNRRTTASGTQAAPASSIRSQNTARQTASGTQAASSRRTATSRDVSATQSSTNRPRQSVTRTPQGATP